MTHPAPPNPFGDGGLIVLTPPPDGGDIEVPLKILVQMAISGTVDDGITEHANELFAALDDRGPEAWHQTALLLIQYILSGGYFPMGTEGARAYLAGQPPADDRLPALTAMHQATAAWIRAGKDAAAAVLSHAGPAAVAGAVRFLFCVSVGGETGVQPPGRYQEMIAELCAGVH